MLLIARGFIWYGLYLCGMRQCDNANRIFCSTDPANSDRLLHLRNSIYCHRDCSRYYFDNVRLWRIYSDKRIL